MLSLQVSYRSYWLRKALEVLYENKSNLSLKDINLQTAIRVEDLSSTLQSLNLIKYWKGDHLLCVTQKVECFSFPAGTTSTSVTCS